MSKPVGTAAERLAIQLRGVGLRFGVKSVLHDLDLDVGLGQKVAVVGPSGVGKSTILRLLAGLLLPCKGRLSLHGQQQIYLREDQDKPMDVRMVFQSPALLASLSVAENVGFLLRRSRRLSPADIRTRVSRVLEEVGLKGVEDLMPGQLSGGMQKRVSFARAIVEDPTADTSHPPLLLFDEPTAGLDPVACTRIEDMIVKTTEFAEGTAVVVSHVMSTIRRTADHVVMLYGGCAQWYGSVEGFEVTDNPYVRQFRSASLQGPMQPELT
ncbi:ABC transporter ATP-binding protein [Candidatus Synechococcus spongiarum]|uniref:Possible ABC transporter, ATP-binding component n=1 Tax=Candidatus Synechococcus spongiarum TaxID=431041 RepID=A0A161KA53_9SYNE|nr:ATP-binding cassette domain-containing protein [Candidatus Synechococcus spongiarum]CZB13313.1 Possible ABC transporter, ATP-binding component [Candidatus Synechococcus spongiarum]